MEGAPAAAADEAAGASREARSAMSTSAPRDGGLSPPVAIAAAGPPRVSRVGTGVLGLFFIAGFGTLEGLSFGIFYFTKFALVPAVAGPRSDR